MATLQDLLEALQAAPEDHGHDDSGFLVAAKAIEARDLLRVKRCLSMGLDPNIKGSQGYQGMPLLSFACQKGDARIVRALLEGNADLACVNRVGGTPLMEAAAFGHLPLVKFLQGRGADPQTKSYKGNTALDIARREGKSDVANFLEALELEGCHPGVACDISGMMPIVGLRYKMHENLHEDYDLCEAEYKKLPPSGPPLSQENFRCIAPKTFAKSLPKGNERLDVDLLKAAKAGDVKAAKGLLDKGIGTDVTDMVPTSHPPALLWACLCQ